MKSLTAAEVELRNKYYNEVALPKVAERTNKIMCSIMKPLVKRSLITLSNYGPIT